MAIDYVKSGVAVGVGVVDEVLEAMDDKAGRSASFKTWKDYGRLGLALVGYGGQIFMPKQERIFEGIALASTPLLVKSIGKPLREKMTQHTTKSNFAARRYVRDWAPSNANAPGYRPL